METKKIKVIVKAKTTNDGKKSFNTYQTVTKNGRLMELKFRKEVKNLPEATCMAIIECDNMNVDNSREYPCLWVKAVVDYESLEQNASETNKAKLDEFFD